MFRLMPQGCLVLVDERKVRPLERYDDLRVPEKPEDTRRDDENHSRCEDCDDPKQDRKGRRNESPNIRKESSELSEQRH